MPEPTLPPRSFLSDESAATVVEYGLVVALISAVIMGALGTTGQNLVGVFGRLSTTLVNAGS